MSVFADVGPGRPRGGLWAVEIGQDVFQVFFISSLAQDLFDDAGGDGYSTLGSVFILPERQRNKIIFLLSARRRGYDDLPSSQTLQQSWICLCFWFFFSLSLKCGKYNPIGQTSLRTQSIASFHQRKKKLNPNTERLTVTRQHPVPIGSTRQPPYSRQKFINKACLAINGTQAFFSWIRRLEEASESNPPSPPKLSIVVTNMRRAGHKGSDWDSSVSPVPQTTALFCPSDVRGHNYV